jgi:hypothetical protein
MFYGSTLLATDFGPNSWQVKLFYLVLFFIPRANPDHEKLYPLVKKWYLELDDSGIPVREIGLNLEGRPVFGAPDKRNFGFWTDSAKAFKKDELGLVSADEFERLWAEIQSTKVDW